MPRINHVVLLRVRRDVDAAPLLSALAELRDEIPGLLSFTGGPYASPEGLHRGYTHAFVMVFASAEARDAYLPHPAHERVKADVLAALDEAGPLPAVVAFDYALPEE